MSKDTQQRLDPAQVAAFRQAVLTKLTYAVGKDLGHALDHDWFEAIALAVRDHIVDPWMEHSRESDRSRGKRVYYLSLEFLIGRLLFDNLSNLGLTEVAREALAELDVDLDRIRGLEPDAALGNGGLGRLAACFMESMATLGLAAYGYGIRYEHGMFRQAIVNGWQDEQTETWLDFGNPWEFERPEVSYEIGFGGRVTHVPEDPAGQRQNWEPAQVVRSIAYDTPVVGWRGRSVNTLRLWRARALQDLHLDLFNAGDHVGAVLEETQAETISRVLYPADDSEAGQRLRLVQEYFFVSASLQDLLRRFLAQDGSLAELPQRVAVQLNDTHPAIAVAELMRLLLDAHGLDWDEAWAATLGTLAYTNHTLLPEALETWPVGLMEQILPRHMQIIYLINSYHIEALRAKDMHDLELIQAVSLIEENGIRRVRMGNLAFLGSHSINGVSALHTELMRNTVFKYLHRLYPERINNKTNGITFRRWLYEANPQLTRLLVESLDAKLLDDPEARLSDLEALAEEAAFRQRFQLQRREAKLALSRLIEERVGVAVSPDALFDVQIKRIHEYKRQLLNLLHTVALYQAMRDEPHREWVPRVKIFAGKAASAYRDAKLIIKLANDIAQVVNNDPNVGGLLKVVFLPNYNVSLAEAIIPAADLSEQISTAGYEASGTGNMKFAVNGALTIGTLDGANVELSERIDPAHMFIFGLKAEQIQQHKDNGDFAAGPWLEGSRRLREALNAIQRGAFSPDDPGRYRDYLDRLIAHDTFFVCADFDDYWATQHRVADYWRSPDQWWRSAVLNTARVGWFSSDRAIREYAQDIWKAL